MDDEAEILGLPEESDWILYGPIFDVTLLRNVYAYELSRRIGGKVLDLWVDSTTATGRATRVIVETEAGLHVLTGEEFRTAVGFTRLRSTWFVVEVGMGDGQQRPVRFIGRGSGHGVGMCQWGARSLSEDGFGWREILQYYYPGSTIDAMY